MTKKAAEEGKITKADAIRAALADGVDQPSEGVAYVKVNRTFGDFLDVISLDNRLPNSPPGSREPALGIGTSLIDPHQKDRNVVGIITTPSITSATDETTGVTTTTVVRKETPLNPEQQAYKDICVARMDAVRDSDFVRDLMSIHWLAEELAAKAKAFYAKQPWGVADQIVTSAGLPTDPGPGPAGAPSPDGRWS